MPEELWPVAGGLVLVPLNHASGKNQPKLKKGPDKGGDERGGTRWRCGVRGMRQERSGQAKVERCPEDGQPCDTGAIAGHQGEGKVVGDEKDSDIHTQTFEKTQIPFLGTQRARSSSVKQRNFSGHHKVTRFRRK